MKKNIRLLIAEDSPDDALLLVEHLTREGYAVNSLRVESAPEMEKALAEGSWDIVISDFRMPHFTCAEALQILRKGGYDTPFIIVSGTIGEETAVDLMRSGANDYIMKNNLRRLAPAVERELRDAVVRRQRRIAEATLVESEEKYRLLFTNTLDAVFLASPDRTIIGANPAAARTFRVTEAELVGTRLDDLVDPSVEQQPSAVMEALAGGNFRGEVMFVRKDGLRFPGEVSSSAFVLPHGEPRLSLIIRDITKRKEDERTILSEKERWERTFDAIVDPIMILDPDHRVLRANKAMAEALGMAPAETIGRKCYELSHGTSSPPDFCPYRTLLGDRQFHAAEYNEPRLGGEYFVSVSPLVAPDGSLEGCIHYARNITENKAAESALRESEERYRRIFEDDLTANYISTIEGNLIACNPAFLRVFGFVSIEEAQAGNVAGLYKRPEERRNFLRLIEERRRIEGLELELRRKDGRPIYAIENAIGFFDDEGALRQIHGYIFDDTERKTLRQQIIQAQKMEGLGVLAGGIAHDFNNILGIVLAYASMVRMGTSGAEQIDQACDAIIDAVNRGSALVRQILTFARKSEIVFGLIDANLLVKEFVKMLKETFPRTITIITDLGKDIPPMLADVTQLHQCLLNLSVNARDAMPDGGTLTIRTAILTKEAVKPEHPDAGNDTYLCLSVTDTGCGMDEGTKSHIFEPFYTTKEKGKGTGLGLSVVYGILRHHAGFVGLDSAPGRGTTFRLYFPITETAAALSPAEPAALEQIAGGNETILVVEDEEALLLLVQSLLESKGYRVETAADGTAALEVYREKGKEIRLVLTDLGLPGIPGEKVFEEIRKIDGGAKIVLASGYVEPERKSELLKKGARDFIQKPYHPDELLKKIRAVIDER